MGVTVATTRVAAPTSTGNQTITTTDLGGLTPKAVWLVATRAVTDGTAADGAGWYEGVSDGTNHFASAYESEHAAAAMDVQLETVTDKIISIHDGTADNVVDGEATFVQWETDGITINWTDAPASAYLITATFFAGSDLSAHVGGVNVGNTADALIAITDIGFEADVVLTFLREGTTIQDGTWCHGFIHNDRAGTVTQRVLAHKQRNTFGSSRVAAVVRNDCVARIILSSEVLDWNGTAQSFDSQGFDIQLGNGRPPGNHVFGWLALRFGSTPAVDGKVYTLATPTSTGNSTDTGAGFEPQAVFYLPNLTEVVGTIETDADGGSVGLSVIDADEAYCMTISDEDTVGDANTQSLSDNQAVNLPLHAGAAGMAATFVAFTASGITLNWSDVETTARQYPALAIEKEAAGGAFTLTAAQGTYTLTGQAANLLTDRLVTAAQGSYSLSGQAAGLFAGRVLAAAQGSYTVSGQDAGLIADRQLLAGQGSYTLTGQAANLLAGYLLAAAQGSYSLSGQDVNFALTRALLAATGSYTLAGQDAALLAGRLLSAGQGSYTLSGQTAALLAGRLLTASQGDYALTGQAVNLLAARLLSAAQGSYVLAGQDADLIYTPLGGFTLTAETGSYTLTGQAAGLLAARVLVAAQGNYALTGQAAGLFAGYLVTAAQGSYVLAGQDAGLIVARLLTAGQGTYTLTGQDAGLNRGFTMLAAQGTYTLTGQAAILLAAFILAAARGNYTLTGQAAAFVWSGAEPAMLDPDNVLYVLLRDRRVYETLRNRRVYEAFRDRRVVKE